MGLYLGHSAVRRVVMANVARVASDAEIAAMAEVVRREAPLTLGLSTGLVYNPAVYSDEREIAALVRAFNAVKPGALFPHLRSESDAIIASAKEVDRGGDRGRRRLLQRALEDRRRAELRPHRRARRLARRRRLAGPDHGEHVPLHRGVDDRRRDLPAGDAGGRTGGVSGGARRSGAARRDDRQDALRFEKLGQFHPLLRRARRHPDRRASGPASATPFSAGALATSRAPPAPTIPTARRPIAAVFDFFAANKGEIAIISHYGNEATMERFFRRKTMAICTDGLMPGPGQKPHPRSLGAFPKALRMAREMGIPLAEMVWRMATLPCRFLNLPDPTLRVGADASLTLFDPATVRESNDYLNPEIRRRGSTACGSTGRWRSTTAG